MKTQITLKISLLTLLLSCNSKQDLVIEEDAAFVAQDTMTSEQKTIIEFLPRIKDSTELISLLIKHYNLEVDYAGKEYDSITKSEIFHLSGTEKELILIEYDYGNGCMAAFPWKYQIIIEPHSGKLVFKGTFDTHQKTIINGEEYLMSTEVTGKGNGNHYLYKYSNNTLVNILNPNIDRIPSCDRYSSDEGYYPNGKLDFKIIDINSDGFEDIVFTGPRNYGTHKN